MGFVQPEIQGLGRNFALSGLRGPLRGPSGTLSIKDWRGRAASVWYGGIGRRV